MTRHTLVGLFACSFACDPSPGPGEATPADAPPATDPTKASAPAAEAVKVEAKAGEVAAAAPETHTAEEVLDAAGGLADAAGDLAGDAGKLAGEALHFASPLGPQPHPPITFKYDGRCPEKSARAGGEYEFKDCLKGPIVAELHRRVKKIAKSTSGLDIEKVVKLEAHVIHASDNSQTGLVAFDLRSTAAPTDPTLPCLAVFEQHDKHAEILQFACGLNSEKFPRFVVKDVIGDKIPEFLTFKLYSPEELDQFDHKIWTTHASSARWRVVLEDIPDCGEGAYMVGELEKGAFQTYCGNAGEGDASPREKHKRHVFHKAIFVADGDKVGAAADDILDDEAPGATAAGMATSKFEALKHKGKKALSRAANTRGYRLYWSADLEGALPLFEAAIAIDPEFGMPHFNAARIYAIWGKVDETVARLLPLKDKKSHKSQLEVAKTAPEFEKVRADEKFMALF